MRFSGVGGEGRREKEKKKKTKIFTRLETKNKLGDLRAHSVDMESCLQSLKVAGYVAHFYQTHRSLAFSHCLRTEPHIVSFFPRLIANWIAASAGLILFNKWLISSGKLPFPVTLTLLHQVSIICLSH